MSCQFKYIFVFLSLCIDQILELPLVDIVRLVAGLLDQELLRKEQSILCREMHFALKQLGEVTLPVAHRMALVHLDRMRWDFHQIVESDEV